jgi:Zn-dependent protease with chaperone function
MEMADGFPSTYVDKKTGAVKRLATIWDKLETDGLLKGMDYALTLGKMALLAPVLGAVAVAAPLGVWVGARTYYGALINRSNQAMNEQSEMLDEKYRVDTPREKADFDNRFGDLQPGFSEDYLRMVKMSGLKEVPAIVVREDMMSFFGSVHSQHDYNAFAASRLDGKEATITIGQGILEQMTPGELRAIVGHEITHLALGHTKDRASWVSRGPVNTVLNVTLLGLGAFGFVPILPAVALVGVSYFAHKCLESINSRRREEECDRGAAILTGGPADLASGLRKLKDITDKAVKQRLLEAKMMGRIFGCGRVPQIRERTKFQKFMKDSHPTNERREGLLVKFEQKYQSFCEKQRSLFANTFNTVAKPRPKADPDMGFGRGTTVKRFPGGMVIITHGGSARGGFPF